MSAERERRIPWVPYTDAFVNEEREFIVIVELAAMHRENLELSVDGRQIHIKGCRSISQQGTSDARYFRKEIRDGTFEVMVDVPVEFNLSEAKAAYQNGLLRVVVPSIKLGPSN